jgi:hypothetical protein
MPQIELGLQGNLHHSRPIQNRVINISISGAKALDGSVLNGPFTSYYTTEFSPFYSTTSRVRLLAGQFLLEVPDDAINQLIWYFSTEADLKNIRPDRVSRWPQKYASYRARWVTAAVIVTLLSGTSLNANMSKRLGDLSVSRGPAAQDLLDATLRELEDLSAMLEDGGNWGRGLEVASKGSSHPDAPVLSRQWASSDIYNVERVPGVNSRERFGNERRHKKTWRSSRGNIL